MNNILLQIQTDSSNILTYKASNMSCSSFWFWFSLAESILIIFLLFRCLKRKSNLAFSDVSRTEFENEKGAGEIDMGGLMDSIHGARDLYKELSRECHPDKFVNTPQQKVAEEIFQEISLNKRNYKKLIALKDRAINELNLNF